MREAPAQPSAPVLKRRQQAPPRWTRLPPWPPQSYASRRSSTPFLIRQDLRVSDCGVLLAADVSALIHLLLRICRLPRMGVASSRAPPISRQVTKLSEDDAAVRMQSLTRSRNARKARPLGGGNVRL